MEEVEQTCGDVCKGKLGLCQGEVREGLTFRDPRAHGPWV